MRGGERFVAVRAILNTAVVSCTLLATTSSFAAIDKPLLSVVGDFDGDGQLDRVQGFPSANDGAGRVDVYWGNPSFKVAWPTVLSGIKDPATRLVSGRLGESLAVGDFNHDGLDDLAIGAPHYNSTNPALTHSGAVVIIYGCAAAVCGAVDASGAGKPAIGSSLDPSTAVAERISSSIPVAFARFGKSLAAGDFDGDGYDDIAMGAPGDTVSGKLEAGALEILYGSASGIDFSRRQRFHQDYLAGVSPAEAYDHFATALSAATLDSDTRDDLVVGVPDEDYGAEVDAGEVDVFYGGPTGLAVAGWKQFRHDSAITGGSRSGDRLGYDVSAFNHFLAPSGLIRLGLSEATSCGGESGYLALFSDVLGTVSPAATLHCTANVCSAASSPGDGALPEIPVNFIVIANSATVPQNKLAELPGAAWAGSDPITGKPIAGAGYFHSMIDLLNQQLRTTDGAPVCDGNDCLRLAYRSHTFYSTNMFNAGAVNVCKKLHAIANPSANLLGESPLAITANCEDTSSCPFQSVGVRYSTFSDFAEAAVDECSLLTDDTALNVLVYDVCDHGPGNVLDCVGNQDGRGRVNSHHPYFFVDYARALRPRTPATTFPWAAEDHEAGHAFGLQHACEPAGHGGNTGTMQTGACVDGLGYRNLGFSTIPRTDVLGQVIVEVALMIATARDHTVEWLCP